jgi:ribose transport system permease protein/L-arabinose transport system permease protein
MAEAVSILGILAIAQTPVMISGGLDLSVGTAGALAGVVSALAMQHTNHAVVGIAVALAVGLGAGILNALLVTLGRVNAIIATLATLSLFQGLAYLATDGQPVALSNSWLLSWTTARPAGLPIYSIITVIFMVIVASFLSMTKQGRYLYAIGGNAISARLAGLPVARFRLAIYAFSGTVAGFAGLLYAVRASAAEPSQSQDIALLVITAVILGGASLSGGRGTVLGSVLGVIVIGELQNAMILTAVPTYYQFILQGVLLAGAVMLHERRRPALR